MKKTQLFGMLFCLVVTVVMAVIMTFLLIEMHYETDSISLIRLYNAAANLEHVPALPTLYLIVVLILAFLSYVSLIFELIIFSIVRAKKPVKKNDSSVDN